MYLYLVEGTHWDITATKAAIFTGSSYKKDWRNNRQYVSSGRDAAHKLMINMFSLQCTLNTQTVHANHLLLMKPSLAALFKESSLCIPRANIPAQRLCTPSAAWLVKSNVDPLFKGKSQHISSPVRSSTPLDQTDCGRWIYNTINVWLLQPHLTPFVSLTK